MLTKKKREDTNDQYHKFKKVITTDPTDVKYIKRKTTNNTMFTNLI